MLGTDSPRGTTPAAIPLEIRVLGPVEVVWNGRPVDIGGVKARALVARLLIDRGLVVSVDRLVDSLSRDNGGGGAEIALRSTISRLRKRLRDAGVPGDSIVTRAPGYVLDVADEVTDVFRFERLVAEGRHQLARRRPSESARLLKEAEDLWRGPAYSEVRDEPFARAEARRLEELLLSATETRIDASLTMGHHQALASELESLTSAYPLRERLWSQRMLALYRAGRQAEALRVFQDLRAILVAELGIEPGHDIAWLEHAILTQDPALDFPVPPEAGSGAPAYPPAATSPPRSRAVVSGRHPREPVRRPRRASRRCCGTGGPRCATAAGASSSSTETLGSERRASSSNWRAPWKRARGSGLWGRCDEDHVAPFQPFAEALGRYFQLPSADWISHMPDWQLAELSRLVPRLR